MKNRKRPTRSALATRREALRLMGVAGLAVAARCNTDLASIDGGASGPTPGCILTPRIVEGPYFVDEMLNRSDIRIDPTTGIAEAGVPLKLTFNVSRVIGSACSPLAGALVDVWHCNARGIYSDAPANNTAGRKFLRGFQTTDANGIAAFTTIYPGWYTGRTVHIHFKVRTFSGSQTTSEFNSQLYFDEMLTAQVFAQSPYNTRTGRDRTNAGDSLYSAETQVIAAPDGDGYAVTFDVGVQP